ncbi:MAG: hypothetical protein JW745_09040, partial [Sedimentisphaerales bacterium]|nr:hypothetical protein [Sedimentisphaerales bacterium]
LFSGELIGLLKTASGQVVLLGVLVCLIGIGFSGQAGIRKERELTDQVKRQSVSEFNFVKGISVAIVSGLASAAMAYGFAAGKPIAQIALANNVPALWQNLPVLIIILAGGFLSNCIWCLYLIVKNKRCAEFVLPDTPGRLNVLLVNYLLCLIGGVTWYMQFFFYSMGSVKMGKYDFSSWTIHMAAIIIFSTIWGISLKEWQGTSEKTRLWVIAGLLTLILSTVIIGIGNKLAVSN